MTNDANDFDGCTKAVQESICGIKGSVKVTRMGTVQWSITDDSGQHHYLNLDNGFLYETLPLHILSPHHWDQTLKGKWRGRVRSTIDGEASFLTWSASDSEKPFRKTIPHDKHANVLIMRSAPGYSLFSSFCKQTEAATKDDTTMMCCYANI
jgi:hypothetical protein